MDDLPGWGPILITALAGTVCMILAWTRHPDPLPAYAGHALYAFSCLLALITGPAPLRIAAVIALLLNLAVLIQRIRTDS